MSDLLARVVVAVPAAVFAGLIIWQGGWVFAAGIGLLAVICVHELSVMLERARPVRLAAMLGVLGLVVAGTAGDERPGLFGMGVAHAAMLRGLDHGGALVVMILLGTFVGDTFAYFGGRAFGRHKLAPTISPNKTLEG